jgi:hypothetical protein
MRIPVDRRTLAIAQGAYFAGTGAWPLVSRGSFERVTGPKRDFWLVKTLGVLVAVMGGVMVAAGVRERVTPEVQLLGQGSAAGFAIIESYYVQQGRIPPVYLVDAFAELLLLAGWAVLPDPAPPGPAAAPPRRLRRSRGARAPRRFLSSRR